ncbi:hypothetical protein [Streptomyces sp. NPDC051576]|uniref:esterase/lipase family protein n=1 Tax=Streptomyces sp. NPDC051576 TaxID=3155803 RepID=UPI0034124233
MHPPRPRHAAHRDRPPAAARRRTGRGTPPDRVRTLRLGAHVRLVAGFEADGYPADRLFTFDHDSTRSNATTAAELAAYVQSVRAATGADKVDLVTHSMGSLNGRYC